MSQMHFLNRTRRRRKLISNWILTSCQTHRVTSRRSHMQHNNNSDNSVQLTIKSHFLLAFAQMVDAPTQV